MKFSKVSVLLLAMLCPSLAHSQFPVVDWNGTKAYAPDKPFIGLQCIGPVCPSSGASTPAAVSGIVASANQLSIFGDSIACGTGPSNPWIVNGTGPFTDMAGLLHGAMGGRYVPECRSGDQEADSSLERVWPSGGANTGAPVLYIDELVTNDVTHYNTNANQQKIFQRVKLGSLSFLATPAANKIGGGQSLSGTYGELDLRPGTCYSSGTSGNTATFTFATSAANQAVYFWYPIFDGTTGTFTLGLDGSPVTDTLESTTTFISYGDAGAAIATQNGVTEAVAGVRIVVASAGSHALVQTVTSSGQPVATCGIGISPTAAPAGLAVVAVSANHRYGAYASLDSLVPTYNGYISSIVALLAADHENVSYANTHDAIPNVSTYTVDGLHPTDAASVIIAATIQGAAPSAFFDGNTVLNSSQYPETNPPHAANSAEESSYFPNGITFYRGNGQTSFLGGAPGAASDLVTRGYDLCFQGYQGNKPIGYSYAGQSDCWMYFKHNGVIYIGGGTSVVDNFGNRSGGASQVRIPTQFYVGAANYSLNNGDAVTQDFGSKTTTAATSDVLSGVHVYTSGVCQAVPTNPTAAAMTGVYAIITSQYVITLYHPATAGATFEFFCSAAQTS